MTDGNSARARAGGGGLESSVRYQPDERPPEALAFGLGLQMAILQIAGIVLTPAIVIRAAGLGEPYLSWAVFAALIVCGLSTILQANRVGRFGAGHVLLMGTSGAFIAISVAALREGGPALLAVLGPRFLPVPVRAGFPAHLAAPRDHPDGRRDRDHADRGHGDAHPLPDAG